MEPEAANEKEIATLARYSSDLFELLANAVLGRKVAERLQHDLELHHVATRVLL